MLIKNRKQIINSDNYKMKSEEFNSIYIKSWTILHQKFNKKYEIFYNNINIKSNFELFKQFTMNIDSKGINQVYEEIQNL